MVDPCYPPIVAMVGPYMVDPCYPPYPPIVAMADPCMADPWYPPYPPIVAMVDPCTVDPCLGESAQPGKVELRAIRRWRSHCILIQQV
jgi:hypothetical protein